MTMEKTSALEAKLIDFMKALLKLDNDVNLKPDTNLIDEVGLDSIEAFDAVATLHDLMDVTIPEDFNAKSVSSLRQLAAFIESRYSEEEVARLLNADLAALAFSWSESD